MANCIRGQGQAPPPKTPAPWGTDTPVPQTPSANFYGLVLGMALGATRGDAELETDWERFGCQWGSSMEIVGARCCVPPPYFPVPSPDSIQPMFIVYS